MATKDEYIEGLKWRLDEIKIEILDLQKAIKKLFNEVEIRQEQVQHIVLLLKTEGIDIDDPELASLTDTAITDNVYDFLIKENKKIPLHYNDLTKAIMAKGILIPGKNPASNLLSHINRDDRFIRTAPGTYGLKEWGIQEMTQKKRKSKKKAK